MALLRAEGLTKRFGATLALDALDLAVQRGEFLALLGGSGSGKSTLLRVIAGFETPEAGSLTLDGADLLPLPPHRRPVSMMFQSYALFPHLSVFDNIAYGLRRERLPRAEVDRRVQEGLALVGLQGLEARRPAQLSGGQKQRVALVRSLVKRPPLLLLDEPLGALDAGLRERTGFELRALQQASGASFVMVTHDQQEALALADRVAVLDQGRLAQLGTPQALYESPASRLVAGFLGGANLLEGRLREDGRVQTADALLRLPAPLARPAGAAVTVAVRPERIRLLPEDAPSEDNAIAATLRERAYHGDAWVCLVALPSGQALRLRLPGGAPPPPAGSSVVLGWPVDATIPLAD